MMTGGIGVDYRVEFARQEDEPELRGILLETDMDLAGDIGEHVVITRDGEIFGGAFLTHTGGDRFHLAVIAVKEGGRHLGIGRQLLGELVRRPWLHSRNADGATRERYTVTTVAKGGSAPFYRKHGFLDFDFAALAEPYRGQCGECPDREECAPVALHYQGRAPQPEGLA